MKTPLGGDFFTTAQLLRRERLVFTAPIHASLNHRSAPSLLATNH